MELLRPLAEGLACFSEFDSIPGRSNVLTAPMLLAFFTFGGLTEKPVTPHEINTRLFDLLSRVRLNPFMFLRKENVLADHFHLKSGGYLAGYMALKNIWTFAIKESALSHDPELFSAFIRSYFYDDYALIAILPDEDKSEIKAENAIAQYIFDRFKGLFKINWEDLLRDFERHYSRTCSLTSGIVHTDVAGLSNDAELAELGKSRLENLVKELAVPWNPTALTRKWRSSIFGAWQSASCFASEAWMRRSRSTITVGFRFELSKPMA